MVSHAPASLEFRLENVAINYATEIGAHLRKVNSPVYPNYSLMDEFRRRHGVINSVAHKAKRGAVSIDYMTFDYDEPSPEAIHISDGVRDFFACDDRTDNSLWVVISDVSVANAISQAGRKAVVYPSAFDGYFESASRVSKQGHERRTQSGQPQQWQPARYSFFMESSNSDALMQLLEKIFPFALMGKIKY